MAQQKQRKQLILTDDKNIFTYCFLPIQRLQPNFNTDGIRNFMYTKDRSSRPEVSLGKVVVKMCSKFTGEHPCRSVISIKVLCNFIEITLRHGSSPVNLLHIFTISFPRNTSERLLWQAQWRQYKIKNILFQNAMTTYTTQFMNHTYQTT